MQDAKEEVRARLAIEDIVGEYVELKRAGRSFKALSPFTDERTPSFIVSPEKQIWHDFSSGKGGDIFSFVMLMEGMDFRQSLEHLARKAGVELEQFAKGDGKFAKRKEHRIWFASVPGCSGRARIKIQGRRAYQHEVSRQGMGQLGPF